MQRRTTSRAAAPALRTHAPQRARRTRGTASVEAVIALPVLILVLIGISYVHRLYAAKQQTLLAARRGAWTQAVSGCTLGPSATASGPGAASSGISTYVAPSGKHGDDNGLAKIPIVGEALSNFVLPGTSGVASARVQRPKLLDGGVDTLATESYVGCNEPHRDAHKDALSVFTDLVSEKL
jgi:hypothetical protein